MKDAKGHGSAAHQTGVAEVGKSGPFTPLETAVLEALVSRGEGGTMYSHEIAGYAKATKEQISGIVASLVKKGEVSKGSFGPGEDYIEHIGSYRRVK